MDTETMFAHVQEEQPNMLYKYLDVDVRNRKIEAETANELVFIRNDIIDVMNGDKNAIEHSYYDVMKYGTEDEIDHWYRCADNFLDLMNEIRSATRKYPLWNLEDETSAKKALTYWRKIQNKLF